MTKERLAKSVKAYKLGVLSLEGLLADLDVFCATPTEVEAEAFPGYQQRRKNCTECGKAVNSAESHYHWCSLATK